MQLRPELADGFEERQIAGVELACVFHHVCSTGINEPRVPGSPLRSGLALPDLS
jgi:hypothetical protein